MYTQCPECSVAFRVTAEVLRQAAGRVRCGGCGSAFNALAYLSEDRPTPRVQPDPVPHVPELTPEPPGDSDDARPRTMSAEQSAALLKTLDQLAGEDIRIEDTGVEWRVITDDADDVDDVADDDVTDGGASASARYLVRDDADPVAAGNDDDAAVDEGEYLVDEGPLPPAAEELRFDDNTPLPEDFEFEAAPVAPPVMSAERPAEPRDDPQADLDLGDPEEWRDLLGDLDDEAPEWAAAADADAVPGHEEPVADAGELDDEAPEWAAAADADATPGHEKPVADAGDFEEFGDLDFAADAAEAPPETGDDGDEIATAAEAAAPGTTFGDEDDEEITSIDDDLIAAAFETEAAARNAAKRAVEATAGAHGRTGPWADDPEEPPADDGDLHPAEPEEELPVELPEETDYAGDEIPGDDRLMETIAGARPVDFVIDDELLPGRGPGKGRGSDGADSEHFVPEMTEEEKTINMLIDQDLLAIAVEDEDGFTSTIVQKQVSSTDDIPGEYAAGDDEPQESPLVETIIMEGEFVRGELDRERLAADKKAAAALAAAAKQAASDNRSGRPRQPGIIAGCVVLLLVLGLQVVHQSREALATTPAINGLIAPVYRAIGSPVTPSWDVSGWRFEASKNNTDEDGRLLTIYSRIGNTADAALPYPLIHVSLTDRFEETIGSRVMEPSEYLVGDADPRQAVAPGSTFDAVISIELPTAGTAAGEAPAPEATGFKLNVCYRVATGQLRCAIEDFK